jgi:putative transferase (TIGR04331 family)
MDAVVAEPYGLQLRQRERDLEYLADLVNRLLRELTDALNAFHSTTHSPRYWRIMLGRWLERYVAVTFNRYFTLELALTTHQVSGTTVFDSANYTLAATDSLEFQLALFGDTWNHVLYARILQFWGTIKLDTIAIPLRDMSSWVQEAEASVTQKRSLKRILGQTTRGCLSRFARKTDAFIVGSTLPIRLELMLQLSLGQCPQLWRSPELMTCMPDKEKRQHFNIDAANYDGFERFVRLHLSEILPSCYLEGYDRLVRQVERLPWPSKPRFIFTSINFDTDEVFKAWTGSMVERGVPYYIGQHGNNYATLIASRHWSELVMCDRFLTWGWSDSDARTTPAFVFKTAGRKPPPRVPDGGALMLVLSPPLRRTAADEYYEFKVDQEDQFRFVEALPAHIQRQLTVRIKPDHASTAWSQEQRWRDRCPHTRIEPGVAKLEASIAESRLLVYAYDSTGILEALALNTPILCFWRGGLDHLLPGAKPYYELLIRAGILALSPERAAELLALYWDNVSEWWDSPTVQAARKAFCQRYANHVQDPIRTLNRLLTMAATVPISGPGHARLGAPSLAESGEQTHR